MGAGAGARARARGADTRWAAAAAAAGRRHREELDIDLGDILYKIRCVVFPFQIDRAVLMANPDFWGPLFCIVAYAMVLMWGQFGVVSWTITFWLFGSFLIFVLARSLGSEVSYSQAVGVIGYSVLPLILAVVVVTLCRLSSDSWAAFSVKTLCTLWAALSAGSLLVTQETESKKFLLMYPLFLLFLYFTSMQSGI